jgi:hypothetical protein
MNADLLTLVAAFVNDRVLRERLGYNFDTCIRRRMVPIKLPPSECFTHLAELWRVRARVYSQSEGSVTIAWTTLDVKRDVLVSFKREFSDRPGSRKVACTMMVTKHVKFSPRLSEGAHLVAIPQWQREQERFTVWFEDIGTPIIGSGWIKWLPLWQKRRSCHNNLVAVFNADLLTE